MRWRPLSDFTDVRAGKLHRLRRARRRRIAVPDTVWAEVYGPLRADQVGEPPMDLPLIVRSASPEEDTAEGTAAGRFETVVVRERDAFADAVVTVATSIGTGAVFVQPLAEEVLGTGSRGGIAFFDGFYYERTEAPEHNRALTAGETRGDVERGSLERGEPFSAWLERLGRAFRSELRSAPALDIEYARAGDRFLLLQARPARFPVRRNPTLSLANHREILGDLPSPWIVSALVRAGEGVMDEFARIDPEVARWGMPYAEECAGRAWLSFSTFFRLMDRWGLPRTFVTEGVGGESAGPRDGRPLLGRMLLRSPRLLRLQAQNVRTMRSIPRRLAELDRVIDESESVQDWFEATRFGLDVALRCNFAINGALSGIGSVRRALGIRGRARVVTEEMMGEYEQVRRRPKAEREAALRGWISRFGHRGPLESDPMQPRFAEMREALLADVMAAPEPAVAGADAPPDGQGFVAAAPPRGGRLFKVDALRERFRDDLMRRWVRLREGTLAAAAPHTRRGQLEDPADIFLLDPGDLGDPDTWRERIAEVRARREREAAMALPMTARRDEIERAAREGLEPSREGDGPLSGIGIGDGRVQGTIVKAADLTVLLAEIERGARPPLTGSSILLVPALEPSWAIVFGRVGGVITDVGGELSHASILLREAGTPAVVNCAGASGRLAGGDRVLLDARAGAVTVSGTAEAPGPGAPARA